MSLLERLASKRVVPKSSRMCCGAVPIHWAMPVAAPFWVISGPLATGQRLSSGLDAGDGVGAGGCVGDEGDEGLAEVLAVAFVVGEEEELVLLDGAAERRAEVVALELGDAGAVEVVARVEEAVAEELVDGAVELVGAAGGGDGYLRAVALAVGGGVGVGDDVELANAIDAEELAGGPAGGGVDQRRAGVLDAIEEEEIVLRAAAGDGEHAAHRGIRGSDAAAALVGVVHGAGVQQDELVVAAAVEGESFDLAASTRPAVCSVEVLTMGWVSLTVTVSWPVTESARLRLRVWPMVRVTVRVVWAKPVASAVRV